MSEPDTWEGQRRHRAGEGLLRALAAMAERPDLGVTAALYEALGTVAGPNDWTGEVEAFDALHQALRECGEAAPPANAAIPGRVSRCVEQRLREIAAHWLAGGSSEAHR